MGRFSGVWAERMEWTIKYLAFCNRCPKSRLNVAFITTYAVAAFGSYSGRSRLGVVESFENRVFEIGLDRALSDFW
ncbi:hypothetical protein OAV86_02995 [Pseudomonadales bacterium]|nr:hypothetical protein [Pseudomonadales bacterium]